MQTSQKLRTKSYGKNYHDLTIYVAILELNNKSSSLDKGTHDRDDVWISDVN